MKAIRNWSQLVSRKPLPNKLLNLTLDSILLSRPLQSGAFKARLASRYAEVRNNA